MYKVTNGYMSHSKEFPLEVAKAHIQMEYYQPAVFRRKTERESGFQHLQDGIEEVI